MDQLTIHWHPVVVHFPIALLLTALILQAAGLCWQKESWQEAAMTIYLIAALILPVVVRTGSFEMEHLKLHHPVAEWHEELGEILLWTVLGSLPVLGGIHLWRRKWFPAAFLVVLAAAGVLVGLTAYNGGRLVYEYGVGVAL